MDMSAKPEKISSGRVQTCLEFCSDKDNCLSLNDILRSFNAPLSEEQAWSLIYQSVLLYRNFIRIEFIDKHTKKDATQKSSHRIKVPKSTRNLNVHKDGSVHICDNGESSCDVSNIKVLCFVLWEEKGKSICNATMKSVFVFVLHQLMHASVVPTAAKSFQIPFIDMFSNRFG